MNLRQLEILRAIVRYNTTVAAGRVLGLSQPAISNALKTMEEQVGFSLFQRSNNRIFPTEETKILLNEAETIFEIHKRIEMRIEDLKNNRIGQLRMVATPPLGYGVVAKAIQQIQKKKPNLKAFFDVHRYEDVIEYILSHRSEIGFVMGFAEHPGIVSQVVYKGHMVCVMPPEHPLMKLSVVTPQDIVKHRFIALEHGTKLGDAVRHAFRQSKQDLHFAVEVRYGLTACALVNAGVGVAVVDPLTADSSQYSLTQRPFVPEISVMASVVWAENRSLTRVSRQFIREVENIIHDR